MHILPLMSCSLMTVSVYAFIKYARTDNPQFGTEGAIFAFIAVLCMTAHAIIQWS